MDEFTHSDVLRIAAHFNDCLNNRDIDGLAAAMTEGHTFVDSIGRVVAGGRSALRHGRASSPASPTIATYSSTSSCEGAML
jgi:hypothetical protein